MQFHYSSKLSSGFLPVLQYSTSSLKTYDKVTCHIGGTKKKNIILCLAKVLHMQKTAMHIHRLLIAFFPLFTSKLMMFRFRIIFIFQAELNLNSALCCTVVSGSVQLLVSGQRYSNSEYAAAWKIVS